MSARHGVYRQIGRKFLIAATDSMNSATIREKDMSLNIKNRHVSRLAMRDIHPEAVGQAVDDRLAQLHRLEQRFRTGGVFNRPQTFIQPA